MSCYYIFMLFFCCYLMTAFKYKKITISFIALVIHMVHECEWNQIRHALYLFYFMYFNGFFFISFCLYRSKKIYVFSTFILFLTSWIFYCMSSVRNHLTFMTRKTGGSYKTTSLKTLLLKSIFFQLGACKLPYCGILYRIP